MPDESCRRCGNELTTISLCSLCRQSNRKVCPECFMPTLEEIHTGCLTHLFSTNHQLGEHCIGEEKSVYVLSHSHRGSLSPPLTYFDITG